MKGLALNPDEKRRDEIIFGKYEPERYAGGIRRFEDLTYEKLRELAAQGFIDPYDRHNGCPDIAVITGFVSIFPGYALTGYAVSARRDDYRVSLDGLQKNRGADSEIERTVFKEIFGQADEFNANDAEMYCWFD